MLIDWKAIGKRDSAYLTKFLDLLGPDGCLHPQLNLTPDQSGEGGTRSGRLSCSKPNLQAMPKPGTNPVYAPCRQAVCAPPGFSVVEADYSQAEVRIAAHYSQEPALFSIFSEGRDIYREDADALGISRLASKILFLAIQYGAGAWKIAQMLGVSESHGRRYRNEWYARYPRIKRTMYRLSDLAEEKRAIQLWSGRWRHFDGETKSTLCKSPYYTAWNGLIQGSVAEMVRHAMLRLWPVIRDLGGRMMLQVHDSIVFLIPTDKLKLAYALIREHMENFPLWDVRPSVEIKSGPTWLDVKEAA
jgi:DNA polymerase-1